MNADSDVALRRLRVDGGMTANDLLMQFLADVLDVPVVRSRITETTCLGAAYAAGLAVGFWPDLATLRAQWRSDAQWEPAMAAGAARAGAAPVAQGGAAHPRLGGADRQAARQAHSQRLPVSLS